MCAVALIATVHGTAQGQSPPVLIQNPDLVVEVNQSDGSYVLRSADKSPSSLIARIAAKINGQWVFSDQYPKHRATSGGAGGGSAADAKVEISNSGLEGQPDLVCTIQLHSKPAFAEIQVEVRNQTGKTVTVDGIRLLESKGSPVIDLAGAERSARILSDSWSEDRPEIRIHDLGDAADKIHRAVGSQLVYNADSRRSFFVGALTSEKWLTVARLHVDPAQARSTAYEVDSTGTTELTQENSLRTSGPEDRIELRLPLASGQSLSSERIIAGFSHDYHAQLEAYGSWIRSLHHARVTAQTPIGWWSWTAYYYGLNEGTALTNARFLAEKLKEKGYDYFHIDEGYQYARGEYRTTNADKFPHGMQSLEKQVQALGLTPGIWTAPFEISERSWVYQNHKDWLVQNANGEPIHAGRAAEDPQTKQPLDHLFVLDTTNPGAQDYLRQTYSTLTKDWGIRYIKLDFMEDTAVEGYYYRPHTTALEAQRTGLEVIRETVGDQVLLDKDGSPMLNPVGIVDTGRTSLDTGHTFGSSKDAASGIAARYYMNRNFFVADPDAFSVSKQTIIDHPWHGGTQALTLDESRVAIALAAVSGGMFEIGDDLPTAYLDPDRMALLENRDLINMARYGHAAKPLDLMSYAPEDGMPSTFLLRESKRQSILAVFNWTESSRKRVLTISDLESRWRGHNQIVDVLDPDKVIGKDLNSISLNLAPHSVRMLKIVDTSVPAAAPAVTAHFEDHCTTGVSAQFSADADPEGVPVVQYLWDFGDGTREKGASVVHTFTHEGTFKVQLRAESIEGLSAERSFQVTASGRINTRFRPETFRRYVPERR